MITSLRLQHFRSYNDETFEFDPSVNIIVGPNASGKTSLLEALLVTCRGNSYRAKDSELIQFDQPWARLDAGLGDEQRAVKLVMQSSAKAQKEFLIGDKVLKRLQLPRTVPVVLFEPNHLQLLHGSPERRRDYLDDLLEQLQAGYGTIRRHYKRTLAQRNALLKQGPGVGSQLFAWNIRLSELGGHIATARLNLISELGGQLSPLYSKLAQKDNHLRLRYETTVADDQYSSDMLYKLERSHEADFERGFTSYGPHRDDLKIMLNERPAEDAASRGEARTILLSLKLLELDLIEVQRGQPPILLLDDVFSELDGSRRRALTEALASHQTFITTTDADVVVQHFTDCHIIPLS
jgi:DNA replication and repair protein RecF